MANGSTCLAGIVAAKRSRDGSPPSYGPRSFYGRPIYRPYGSYRPRPFYRPYGFYGPRPFL